MLLARRNNFGMDLFDEMFRDPFFSSAFDFGNTNIMKTDVREKDGNYIMDIELPGYSKEDVKAELKDGYLTIQAEKNENSDEKTSQGDFVRRERYSGSCRRSFYVGDSVRQEDIKAGFKDGILRLVVPKETPKAVEEKTTYIPIEG